MRPNARYRSKQAPADWMTEPLSLREYCLLRSCDQLVARVNVRLGNPAASNKPDLSTPWDRGRGLRRTQNRSGPELSLIVRSGTSSGGRATIHQAAVASLSGDGMPRGYPNEE